MLCKQLKEAQLYPAILRILFSRLCCFETAVGEEFSVLAVKTKREAVAEF